VLEPLGFSAYALAQAMGVPCNRVTGILHGARAVSADTALRLGRFFGTSRASGSASSWTTTSSARGPTLAAGSSVK
jgi:addiction module HigA family antidote